MALGVEVARFDGRRIPFWILTLRHLLLSPEVIEWGALAGLSELAPGVVVTIRLLELLIRDQESESTSSG